MRGNENIPLKHPINQNDHTNERNIRPYGGCLGYRVIKQKDPQLTGTCKQDTI